MPRPKGSKNKRTEDLIERWDGYADELEVEPIGFLFQVLKGKPKRGVLTAKACQEINVDVRVRAARELLAYRWPKLKAVEFAFGADDRELIIKWLDPDGTEHSVRTEAPAGGAAPGSD